MRCGQNQRTNDRECPVRRQAQIRVRDRRANNKREHADNTGGYDSTAPVPPETKQQRHRTQRQHNDEHLCMQVAFGKLRKEWQSGNNQWQGQAVDQAQGRKRDCCAIEPVG